MNNTMYFVVLIFLHVSFVTSIYFGYPSYYHFWSKPYPTQTIEYTEAYGELDVYNTGLVLVLNDLKTMNAHPIVFDDNEMTMLWKSSSDGLFRIPQKEAALLKYKRKMQDLQCTNGAIAEFMICQLKRFAKPDNDKTTNDEKIATLDRFKTIVAKMLSILLFGETVAHRWLWLLYFRIYGALDADRSDRDSVVASYLAEDERLGDAISAFTDMCVKHGYLVENYSVANRRFMENLYGELYDSDLLDHVYKYAKLFDVDNLYLRRFWDEHDAVCKAIPAVQVEWTATKALLENAKTLMANHVDNGPWPVKPFQMNVYLKYVIRVCKMQLSVYTWIHLTCYSEIVSKLYSKPDMQLINNRFYGVLSTAAGLLYVKEEFVDELKDLVLFIETTDEREIQNTVTWLMNKIYVESIALGENRLSHNLNETFDRQSCTMEFLLDNLTSVDKYFGTIKNKLDQIDFVFISFFIDGERNQEETFVYNQRLPHREAFSKQLLQWLFQQIFIQ